MTDRETIDVALERCAREPVHAPGAIQPHGVVLVPDRDLHRIEEASANAGALLGRSAGQIVRAPLEAALGERSAAALRRAFSEAGAGKRATVRLDPTAHGEALWATAAATPDEARAVVEIEPDSEGPEARIGLARALENGTGRVAAAETESQACEALAEAMREVTGHERALVYKFDAEFNGQVVGESRHASMASYMNLRFPATDIPPQVRARYRENAVRVIVDAAAESVPLVTAGSGEDTSAADLSRAVYRAVSPVHLEYLHQMGVGSSLSVALYGANDLWGLVACHSRGPKSVSPETRCFAATLARAAAQRILYLVERTDTAYHQWIHQLRLELAEAARRYTSAHDVVHAQSGSLLRAFDANGAAFVQGGKRTLVGDCPPEELVSRILGWLAETEAGSPYATEMLADELPAAAGHEATACGLLAVSLSFRKSRDWLLLFRREEPAVALWAGNPEKPAESDETEASLSPRRSFETWRDRRRGRSADWSAAEIRAGRDLAHDIAVIASEVEIRQLNEQLKTDQEALAQANAELATQAEIDNLTGAGSREWVEGLARWRIEGRRQGEERFAVLLLDLDHFKEVNDRLGHEAGDRALQAFVRVVRGLLRDDDQLGRWGGEEFLVLASDVDERGALALAERLREGVAESDDPDLAGITASVGVAPYEGEPTVRELVARADAGLYAAKRAGRNAARIGEEPGGNGRAR